MQDQSKQTNSLETFINGLIDKRGYADASPAVRESLYKDLTERMHEFIMARSIAALSDEDVALFEKMLDEKKSSAELQQFIQDRIPDYTTFLASALLEFQDVYLGA